MWQVLIAFVILILSVWWMMRSKPTVYGSMQCPHTVNMRNKVGRHVFVDCTKRTCPEYVTAYPTTMYPNGTIKVGEQ